MEDPQQKCCWNLEDAEQPWDVEVFPAVLIFCQGNTAFQNAQRPSSSQSLEPSQADQLWLKSEPKVRLWRLVGQETPSRLWLKRSPKSKFLRLLGRVTCSRLWSNIRPKVRLCKVLGKVTRSRLWFKKKPPNVKLCRLVAKVTRSRDKIARFSNSLAFGGVQDSGSTSHQELNLPDCPAASRGRSSNQGQDIAAWEGHGVKALIKGIAKSQVFQTVLTTGHVFVRLWFNLWSRVRHCRLLGKIMFSRLWSNIHPKVKHCRLPGKVTRSRLWSNPKQRVRWCRPSGKITCSRLWLKSPPKVKLWRLLGQDTPSRLCLKCRPKVKLCRLLGKDTPARLVLNSSPKVN